ncbi:MAG: alpha/beta hydrolase [Isosphaeraceae bacterium]|nr:alpha/beta hydrolase [Isosphaeraceae bacterium]
MSRVSQTVAAVRSLPMVTVLRVGAWAALLGATGLLVRAEARRSELPAGVTAETDIVYRRTPARRLRLDVYEPMDVGAVSERGRPVVLAIHGGGWAGGSRISFGQMVARLAQHGYVAVSVDYTLCRPGHPSWPAALDDLREAVRWIRSHARQYRIDPDRVVALGASAGGHLAALLGTTAGDDAGLKVQAVIDFYGPSDLLVLATENQDASRVIAQFLGADANERPGLWEAASPARQVSAGAPPMLLVHGADDTHVPPNQSELLAAALRTAGVPSRLVVVSGARHGFHFRIDDQRDLLPEILAFLATVWDPPKTADFP